MKNKQIMQSLPLVAAVLGNKYGVNVSIGGSEAFTDGNNIHLPGLPSDNDEIITGLTRGFIDHESAHIRETDFDAVEKANLTPLEMNIWNCIEDWRVENRLVTIYPGCRSNFHWLIRHLFADGKIDGRKPTANLIPNWILLTVRSWDVNEVAGLRDQAKKVIEKSYPGLCGKVSSVLEEIRLNCRTTVNSITYAKKIVFLLKDDTKPKSASQPPVYKAASGQKPPKNTHPDGEYSDFENQLSIPQRQLEKLINANPDELPKNMGEILAGHLTKKASTDRQKKIQVAVVGNRLFKRFDSAKSPELTRSTTALKTRLHSVLQSALLRRSHKARHGKLDTGRLHKIAVSDPRIFVKPEEKQGFNTAVHILIDCSGSMRRRMKLTINACYALAKALDSTKGISVGVTSFPANRPRINGRTNYDLEAVCPIVRHGERIHSRFHTKASGCTPMGEAIWWILQEMLPLMESRKIILILTDGDPDCLSNTMEAIKQGKRLGFEFYGIGIETSATENILPGHSCTIGDLSELAPSMFKVMKTIFINN